MATTIGIKLFYRLPTYDTDKGWETPRNFFEDEYTGTDTATQLKADMDAINIQLKGVSSIPELQGAPSSISTTSLEDYEEQSEPGLIGNSQLIFTMNYKLVGYGDDAESDTARYINPMTKKQFNFGDGSNFQECLNLDGLDIAIPFKIVLPNGRWFAFWAKVKTVAGALNQASALTYSLVFYKKSRVATGWNRPETAINTRIITQSLIDTDDVE